jgi:hypothetical protein
MISSKHLETSGPVKLYKSKVHQSLSTPLWHAVFDMSQKMPFPAMQAEVVHKEGCCMYYVVGVGPKSVEKGRADWEMCECQSTLGDGIGSRVRMKAGDTSWSARSTKGSIETFLRQMQGIFNDVVNRDASDH